MKREYWYVLLGVAALAIVLWAAIGRQQAQVQRKAVSPAPPTAGSGPPREPGEPAGTVGAPPGPPAGTQGRAKEKSSQY
ncbi:MAG TPA: hypothetical protein VGR30_04105 [Candidatus Binatia bacterium]|jgi:hypothetical protein|nr:hypothetical protein [Candidatus Binatia bacterium]